VPVNFGYISSDPTVVQKKRDIGQLLCFIFVNASNVHLIVSIIMGDDGINEYNFCMLIWFSGMFDSRAVL